MAWWRRLQIRPENYPNALRYRLALGLYIAMAVPLILLAVFGPTAVHALLSVVALCVFAAVDLGALRRPVTAAHE